MAQVAARAGVHPTTVSLALRNHPSIPLPTRERIRGVATEMGYRPDPALSALAAYRHAKMPRRDVPALAYLTHWDSEWGWREPGTHAGFYRGAAAKAAEVGYKLEHFWLGEPGLSHQRMSDILFARGISGVVVASHIPQHDRLLALDWAKFSGVKIDYLPQEPALHRIASDHCAIVRLAMQRITAAGYRRIGMVIPRWWDDCANRTWSAGFLAEQQRLGPEDRLPILFVSEEATAADGRRRGGAVPKDLLGGWVRRHQPEVIMAEARFVRPSLEKLGLGVPRDIAFADLSLEPDGTTAGVRHNCERVGSLAVELLVGQLQHHSPGVPEFATSTLVEGTWFDGATLPLRSARGSGS